MPPIVAERLPLYARTLTKLAAEGLAFVKSQELGQLLGLHPEQIRKDLSYLGHLGKPGHGYEVGRLSQELDRVLGLGVVRRIILVGAGNLGRAILANSDFASGGFEIVAAFDINRGASRAALRGVPVLPISCLAEYLATSPAEVAILAVPPTDAQAVADQLVRGGVRAILNYAPVALRVPSAVLVRSVDPVAKLQAMAFFLGSANEGEAS